MEGRQIESGPVESAQRANARIRPARPADREAIYDICRRTGADGTDASGQVADPDLLGHLYAGQYLSLTSGLALVAEQEGAILGYGLGALDTTAFEQECEQQWWPAVRRAHPDPGPNPASRTEQLARLAHHRPRTLVRIAQRYPSHLHVDLLETARGLGLGRALVDRLSAELTDGGSEGVHVGVSARNAGAQRFWPRVGFTELARDEHSILYGRRLR